MGFISTESRSRGRGKTLTGMLLEEITPEGWEEDKSLMGPRVYDPGSKEVKMKSVLICKFPFSRNTVSVGTDFSHSKGCFPTSNLKVGKE
jgi:hypothetical protein